MLLKDNQIEKFLRTDDGQNIAVRHTKIGSKQVVLVLPGFFQSKNTLTFRLIESLLCSQGFDVISIDFRGHGDSSGFYTFSAKENFDLRAVIDYAEGNYSNIIALGFSLGGAIAIIEQAQKQKLDGLICVGSPRDFRKIEMQWWRLSAMQCQRRSLERGVGCRIGPIWYHKKKAIDCILNLGDAPILMLHGTKDRIVFKQHSQSLYAKANGLKQIKLIDGGSHAEDLFRTHPEEMIKIITNWIHKQVDHKRNGAQAHMMDEKLGKVGK
ncbi:MAG: pimeloyl-ACP methyl ester carboxylesterase [Candidatus Omnitrophota bacterium]|jgi:pimeloyl-ACP methyl ester carboxylesterase